MTAYLSNRIVRPPGCSSLLEVSTVSYVLWCLIRAIVLIVPYVLWCAVHALILTVPYCSTYTFVQCRTCLITYVRTCRTCSSPCTCTYVCTAVCVCMTWYPVIIIWLPTHTHTNTNITSLSLCSLFLYVCVCTYVRAGKDGERRWMVGDGFRHFLILQTGLNSSNNDCMFIGTYAFSHHLPPFLSPSYSPSPFLPLTLPPSYSSYLSSFLLPSYPPFASLFVC